MAVIFWVSSSIQLERDKDVFEFSFLLILGYHVSDLKPNNPKTQNPGRLLKKSFSGRPLKNFKCKARKKFKLEQ